MAFYRIALLLTVITTLAAAQRPFYAGLKPIGYPQLESDLLTNRFGSDEPGPIEFQGDPNYRNRIQQLPQDKQPFWYLNWQQYDDLRKNPQTYPQRPSVFSNSITK
ncbi:uncharacterized protein LOC125231063 [Leguminivora glycinivorella]|uniref:uncharacterized protein LOC125231063 n=1 Tax=Leguminivora glycinivorella TaxID=1035111 RepID=UPI00200F59E5|nr:uncharacterized protein LOC125231063 [Leguminivora glycinivorella]